MKGNRRGRATRNAGARQARARARDPVQAIDDALTRFQAKYDAGKSSDDPLDRLIAAVDLLRAQCRLEERYWGDINDGTFSFIWDLCASIEATATEIADWMRKDAEKL